MGGVDVRPKTHSREPHGRGRAHREHNGASGARGWFGLSGQQLLLSCEATALCGVAVVGSDGACNDELRGWNLPSGR